MRKRSGQRRSYNSKEKFESCHLVSKCENPLTERRDEERNGTVNKELLNQAYGTLRERELRQEKEKCVIWND